MFFVEAFVQESTDMPISASSNLGFIVLQFKKVQAGIC